MWQTLGRHVCLRPNVSWAERTFAERVIEKSGDFLAYSEKRFKCQLFMNS